MQRAIPVSQAILLVVFLATASTALLAQEFRGSIGGQVTDPSGAVLPGVQVAAINLATNTSSNTVTDEDGFYKILYLPPGKYNVTAELPGFKKMERSAIEVRVGDQLALDLRMEVGEMQETINVSAQAPLLQTNTASLGQVIDQKRISELPLSDGNPFVLSRLAPGIAYTGDLKFSRPFDNAGSSSIVVDGSPGGNEFTLDGTPNGASGRRVAFVPPADVVQEFKMETASFDAQQGHTGGGTVNVAMKSGTNKLHGTIYGFLRDEKLSGNDFFLNRGGRPRDQLEYKRWGGTVGGPIWIPKIYKGRDKTFFFFGFEKLDDAFPEPGQFTVPTEAQRRGDLSALLRLGSQYQIYNPFTARRLANGRIERDPIPNNVIATNLLNPISQNYLKFYPLPNTSGDSQGRNNFLSGQVRSDKFHSESYRFDHQLTEKQQMFFRYSHNSRREHRGSWTGTVNGIIPTGNYLFRINNGSTFDHVYTISQSTIFNFRAGFTRFNEFSKRPHEGLFNPASLGFSGATVAFFGGASYFPRFDIGGFSALGDDLSGGSTHNIYSVQPTVIKLRGSHSFKAGYDFRSYRENGIPSRHAAGRYDFGTAYTRGPLDNSTAAPIGQELAAFLLGQTTGGVIDRNAFRSNQTPFHGVFFQDDWKVNDRLTLNLGIRYELELANTERYNRNIRGFDFTSPSPIEDAARRAYAVNPIPEINPADFRVRGGVLFAGQGEGGRRGFWDPDTGGIQPRIGVAYRLGDKTVLRGGWAVYMIPAIIAGVQQPGFSQATNIVPSLDTGVTFRANLNNPFPDGVATPPGASLGLATFLGRGITFLPIDGSNGKTQRWELGIQHELPGNWLLELAYVGTRGYDLSTGLDLNPIPRRFLSTSSAQRDTTVVNFLTANVPNPFRGLVPGTGLDGATVQRQQLLRPFPQFTGVSSNRFDGSTMYHSSQFRAEKRFSRGYTLLTSYTWSKLMEEVSLKNATDTEYESRISRDDIPHRVVVSGIWELPFGRGRTLGTDWPRFVDSFIGGWQVQGIWQAQSGRPLDLGGRNVVFFGDPSKLEINYDNVDRTFDITNFYIGGVVNPGDPRIDLTLNIRQFPTRLPNLRSQPLNLWDLSLIKNVAITEGMKLQLRGEFLNAFNHPQFNDPNTDPRSSNFGKTTSQANLPRNVQLGLKLIF